MLAGARARPRTSPLSGRPLRPAPLGLLLLAACGASPQARPTAQNGPPSTASVRDGLAADLDSQQSRTSLFANWDPFIDPEGLPVVYEWSAGTAPGATDVLGWTALGGATSAMASELQIPIGSPVYVNVRATDMAANLSAVASSDGIVAGQRTPAWQAPAGRAGVPIGHLASIEHGGIAWTFGKPALCGRFANGDWWVQGPVEIVAIAPPSTDDGQRVRHGSCINPDPTSLVQGYDSGMFGDGEQSRFDRSRNVALGVDRSKPLVLAPGSSLVSTVSHPQAGHLPQLARCSVLTVLAEPPAENAFRPPYCGTDKTCRWTADQLDLGRLARLETVDGAPELADLVERLTPVWLDHLPGWTGSYLHPSENMPDYGRDLADLIGQAALALQLDLPVEQKRPLAIAMVQLGLDVAGVVQNGGRFVADGGSGAGRKFPLLLAGTLLRDDALLQLAVVKKFAFAEDAQTFYVAETAPGVVNHGFGGYGPADVGLAEWGNRHADDPSHDQKSWTFDTYRRCCTANAWLGFVLAARILGLEQAWGHDALFDYVDRYLQIEPPQQWTRSWSRFPERMWDRYREQF